jgi:F0F1-type ATP synthase assembly protein I
MRSGSRHSGELSQDSGRPSAHRSPVTRTDAARRTRQLYNSLSASSVGLELGLSVVLCVLLGMWADRQLGTSPWLMILGMALGLAAGFRSVMRSVRRAERAAEREARLG